MENDNKNTKDEVLFVKVSSDEKAEITDIVARLGDDMTVSRFVRESVRKNIAAINESNSATAGATV